MTLRIDAPEQAGSRDQAEALVHDFDKTLVGQNVTLDCSAVLVATPSFLDQIVKEVLESRNADTLEIVGGPPRAQHLVERAAENRGVRDRLRQVVRPTP